MIKADVLRAIDPVEYLAKVHSGEMGDFTRPDGRKSLDEAHEVKIMSKHTLGGIGSAVVQIGGTVVSAQVGFEIGYAEDESDGELLVAISPDRFSDRLEHALAQARSEGVFRALLGLTGATLTVTVDDEDMLVRLPLTITIMDADGCVMAAVLQAGWAALCDAVLPVVTLDGGVARMSSEVLRRLIPLEPARPIAVETTAGYGKAGGRRHVARDPTALEEHQASTLTVEVTSGEDCLGRYGAGVDGEAL